MKSRKLSKKLTLNKKTIVNLSNKSLSNVRGGIEPPSQTCDYGCTETCGTCPNYHTCHTCDPCIIRETDTCPTYPPEPC